ncbi:MAG TPA: hypothetical protein VGL86_02185, partial [Polyangia bacterium]
MSTRQRAFALAAARALGRDAGKFCARQAMASGDELARNAAALGGAAQQRREAETLARPQPSGIDRVDRSWYVAPPARTRRDDAAAHLRRAAYGHLVSMDEAGAGVLSSRAPDEIERVLCALGRRRVALAFVGAPRAGLAQLCARLGEPHATQLVEEVRALKSSSLPPDAAKAAQRAVYVLLGRAGESLEAGKALFFRVGAAWLAPALARDGDELMRAAPRLPRALGQLLLDEGDAVSSDAERTAALSLLANGALRV